MFSSLVSDSGATYNNLVRPERCLFHLGNLRFVQRRIQEMSHSVFEAETAHGVHLVLHQSNQGRDNDGCSGANQGWQLVAQRLPPAGGHQHKGIPAIKHVADDVFLVALKVENPKCFSEHHAAKNQNPGSF
jgi:hypothetical protein